MNRLPHVMGAGTEAEAFLGRLVGYVARITGDGSGTATKRTRKDTEWQPEKKMGRPYRPSHCELCGHPGYGAVGSKPCAGIFFDHDHRTGKARGWLCGRCNKVLGLVKDDQALLTAMISYLRMYSGEANDKAA